jgi:molecular chaperone GrpE
MPSSPASEGDGRRVDERVQTAGEAPSQDRREQAGDQPGAPVGREAEDDREDSARLQEAHDQLEDRYKRALADLDNYRKRSAREVDRRVSDRSEALLRDWLEVVDSVERAVRMEQTESTLFQGLRAVLEQMESILQRHGVTRLGAVGEPFDPERHEAIGVRESDEVPDRTIVEIARSGFALGDRVLRPAQVTVSRRPERAG